MNNRPHGFAILGCGRIAGSHATAIASLAGQARLVGVADNVIERAERLAEQFDVPTAVDDLDALLALTDVDSIIVCTPNELHAEQAIHALSAGKHVLVEKPMADNAADARRMAAAAEAANRVLATGLTFRHTKPIRYIQDRRAKFGRLRAVEASVCVHWDGPQAAWWGTRSPERGLILSLFAPHALDFVQLVVGQEPLSVHCEAARFQSTWQGEDEAMILLRYPQGCLASIHVSYNQSFVIDRKTLHYENALVRIENGDELWVDDEPIMGVTADSMHRMGKRDLRPAFETQLREYLLAVSGKPNRSVLHDEGVRLTVLLDRVLEDARRNSIAE